MNILLGSDLHLELNNKIEPDIELIRQADLIILAGDIHNHTHGLVWARQTFPDKPIIYVAGNHEYDGAHMGGLLSQLRIVADKLDIHFLEGNTFKFRNKYFHGVTLWSDYKLYGDSNFQQCLSEQNLMFPLYMDAYKSRGRQIKALDLVNLNRRAKRYLIEQLSLHAKEDNIVVSHMAPSLKSVPLKYNCMYSTAAFASNLEQIIANTGVWFHGHLHNKVDYNLNGCRIISNCICDSEHLTSNPMRLLVIPD